jgi:DNA polymerase III subunit epsilon
MGERDCPHRARISLVIPEGDFAAIDFETADSGADSACAIGLVVVRNGMIEHAVHRLIRPPRRQFLFTYIHGISWQDVQDKPRFSDVWLELSPLLKGVGFLAAHNAPFDRRVLAACCQAAGLDAPPQPFHCTVQLARKAWKLKPANLPAVCAHLKIALNHHEALSDARACAEIVLAARRDGRKLEARPV